ncbi:MAG: hypothetical protein ACRDOE_05025, partial [Streptosporangiaceae bacterium]
LRDLVLLDLHRRAPSAIGVTDPGCQLVFGADEQRTSTSLNTLLMFGLSQVSLLALGGAVGIVLR